MTALPAKYLGLTFNQAQVEYRDGRMTGEQWTQYQAIWQYASCREPRIGWPTVTEAWSIVSTRRAEADRAAYRDARAFDAVVRKGQKLYRQTR